MSNTTDSSTKKPADGMEQMEITSLPDYGARPIDTWRASHDHNNTHVGFDSLDYPNGDPKVSHISSQNRREALYPQFKSLHIRHTSIFHDIACPMSSKIAIFMWVDRYVISSTHNVLRLVSSWHLIASKILTY